MDATSSATKSRPPFLPTCCSNLGALPPLEDFQSFVAEHRRYEGARKTDEAVVTSTADAAATRHRQDGLNTWRTSWRGPHWVSSTGTEHTSLENVADTQVAVARRRRHVATLSTWRLSDVAAVNSEGLDAFTAYFSEKTATKKTPELQKVTSSDTLRSMHYEVAPAGDVGIKEGNAKAEDAASRVGVSGSRTSGRLRGEGRTGSTRYRKLGEQGSTMRRPTDRGQVPGPPASNMRGCLTPKSAVQVEAFGACQRAVKNGRHGNRPRKRDRGCEDACANAPLIRGRFKDDACSLTRYQRTRNRIYASRSLDADFSTHWAAAAPCTRPVVLTVPRRPRQAPVTHECPRTAAGKRAIQFCSRSARSALSAHLASAVTDKRSIRQCYPLRAHSRPPLSFHTKYRG
ncbi:hypothetical protein MRX96_018561 [Rhipicephalus microplus]